MNYLCSDEFEISNVGALLKATVNQTKNLWGFSMLIDLHANHKIKSTRAIDCVARLIGDIESGQR